MKNIILFFVIAMGLQSLTAQETLRYDLKVGDTFTIDQEVTQEISQTLPGQEQLIINSLSGTLLFKVIGADPSLYKVTMSFTRFRLNMSSPTLGEMMNVDTDQEANTFENKMFQGMLDKPIELQMKPTGEIVGVNNGDAILEGMLAAMGDIGQESKELMRKQLGDEWSAESISQSFEQMTFIYPTEKKAVGESWKNSYAGDGKIQAQNTWTYVSEDKNTKNLTADATILMDVSTEAIDMKLEGEQQSQAIINSTSGFIKKLEVTALASGNAKMPQAPDITIPTTIKSTTTYTLR